jgi:rhamnose utilization protein RhaD (predicted bifunctional aldolase and dehydrogenase)
VLYAAQGSFRPDHSVRVRLKPLVVIGPEGVRPVTLGDAGVPAP